MHTTGSCVHINVHQCVNLYILVMIFVGYDTTVWYNRTLLYTCVTDMGFSDQ